MQATNLDEFEEHRRMLEGLAYRMCGVLADAQDIVQETHLRWCSIERSTIDNPRAWLVTVCSRLAMDVMKSARVRREQYVGTWLPEPFLEPDRRSPDVQAQIDDSVSVALMLAMERLTPSERAAFLLHDVFGYDFREVASIVGKSEASCRKSASRARRAVSEKRPRFEASPDTHRQLLDAFFEAVHAGDPKTLKSLLAESVELHADGGGQVKTAPAASIGREAVAAFFLQVWRENVPSRESVRIVNQWFNGRPGVLIYQDGQLLVALSLSVTKDTIDHIFAMRNPNKLAAFVRHPTFVRSLTTDGVAEAGDAPSDRTHG
jgi:RNA polymerase sigma-70 factor (ECF subfamily)